MSKKSNTIATTSTKCAPKHEGTKNRIGSCLNEKDLAVLVRSTVPKGAKETVRLRKIISEKTKCSEDDELCWVSNAPIDTATKSALNKKFRPIHDADWLDAPKTWLYDFEIENVLQQYSEVYPNFRFMKMYPIDFADKPPYHTSTDSCISQEMCDFDINMFHESNITKIGLGFNLAKLTESGKHWVSMMIDINPKSKQYGCFYYNSAGRRPGIEVENFIKKVNKQLLNRFPNSPIPQKSYSKIRHQFERSECGMFVIWFTIMCITRPNLTYNEIMKIRPSDKYVFDLREAFFNKPKEGAPSYQQRNSNSNSNVSFMNALIGSMGGLLSTRGGGCRKSMPSRKPKPKPVARSGDVKKKPNAVAKAKPKPTVNAKQVPKAKPKAKASR